jgi:transposase
MPKAYSDDLRCRILLAYERKEGSERRLAQRFGVSFEYVRKIRRQFRKSEKMERAEQSRHGPPSRFTDAVKEQMRVWLREQPDRTLAELGELLRSIGVVAKRSRISQVLREMGMVLKKSPSTPRSAIRRPTKSGGKTSSPPSPRSRPSI